MWGTRFPEQVFKQVFPGRGFQEEVSKQVYHFQAKQGSQNRFSNKCLQEEVSRKRCPSKAPIKLVPKQWFKMFLRKRFPSKVPSHRFPGTGAHRRFPRTGSQVRFPSTFPSKVPRKRFPIKVPRNSFSSKVARKRFSSKVPRKRFARKGSQLLLGILLWNQLFLGTLA